MCLDADGNIYTTGVFEGVLDFDPGKDTFNLGSPGKRMAYISKMDPSGNFLWARQFNADSWLSISIAIDHNDMVYLSGTFMGFMDVDPGPDSTFLTSYAQHTAFICKLNSSGNFIWGKDFGYYLPSGNSASFINSIAFDNLNNVYTTGSFTGSIDFDPGPDTFDLHSAGSQNHIYETDIFICKLDSNGHFLWAKQMGGLGHDHGFSIKIDDYGNFYTAGNFSGTVDFDFGQGTFNLSSKGNTDFFISKYDPLGNFSWALRLGSSGNNLLTDFAIDQNYNLYLSGNFQDSMDFDPWSGEHYLHAAALNSFVLKLDNYGNFLWVHSIEGSSGSFFNNINKITAIAMDAAYNVYFTGYFEGGITLAKNILHSEGDYDMLIGKLNSAGNLIWAKKIGDTEIDLANSLAIDKQNNIYITGQFEQTVDFDPWGGNFDLTAIGSFDIFIHKINQCDSAVYEETISSCGPYLWLGRTFDSSGTYIDTLQSIVGCDSIVELSLEVTNIDTSVSIKWATLTAAADSVSYQWIDCNNGNLAIIGETNQSFTPDTNGFYAVAITDGQCSDTSACYAIINAGLEEHPTILKAHVSPNPVGHYLSISFADQLQNASIEILNTKGQLVYSADGFNRKNIKLDMQAYQTGLYFISVKEGDRYFRSKIVKQ